MDLKPKLRNVDKYKPLYPLNKFIEGFAYKLGKELVYLLATRSSPSLEGKDWEEIFAKIIGAEWKPSNIGLDDIVHEQMAWGAKTVKNRQPSTVSKVRLISGRNSPVYSFGDDKLRNREPNELGEKILSIWNERVSSVRKLYKHVRTVVLVKSETLLEAAVFEFETVLYDTSMYWWQWNENDNLEGFIKKRDQHVFTWQPHGSQFTIIEDVPEERLAIRIRKPPVLDKDNLLRAINFEDSWIEII